jgi:hypothetical protein
MEDMLREFLAKQADREAARDREMAELKATIAALAARPAGGQQTAAERAKAEALAALEAEKLQKMRALEDELKPKYEAAGLSFTPLADIRPPTAAEKAENPKTDLIGILNPLPSHVKWTGQSMDANGHYLSFSVWLRHVKQVLDQKESVVWKKAVLDMASLTCLRGRALDWWLGMSSQQQDDLREDFSLELWDTLGKALHRNEQTLRKEARDRKRQFGKTLAEYAWKKTAILQEAFGRNRDVADLIADIKEGLSPTDQEAIRADLQATPTLNKLMTELVRLDTIRGPKFNAAIASGGRPEKANAGRQSQRVSPYPVKSGNQAPWQPLSETYDPKELRMRQNPLLPSKPAQWSYKFPDGRIIYLSSPCAKCGGKHFNFECTKPKSAVARAAFMAPEDPWDESVLGAPDETSEEEDELAVAYVSKGFYEPRSHSGDVYHTPTKHKQIMDEPWDELSMKKEN